ncbi:GrpB family protein [Lysinibacillus xylanilyticus]|uniref:GrpB family protein n=1 Tax=Lysinibacillus xylanilyticus TaxID=582475 RepID=UPI002B250281|nr:GrpB family protein [Lysinibacillus xylanilyticus]MEB2282750.1 GrpB family protein [Lysinibacillus xylanilyticus]
MRIIKVVDHNHKWSNDYQREERSIRAILQEELVNCFHIGSTSVPGLKAKPIIDILLVVNDIHKLESFSKQFQEIGYEVKGEFGITGRRYFRKGGDHRTHQIHAFQYNNIAEIERHLAFRDYLRKHPEVCRQYGEIKSQLAKQYPNDIDGYCHGKDDFVKSVEKEAIKWHWSVR